MPSQEAYARVIELAKKWSALKKWGVAEKLPFTKDTQQDLDRFFTAARNNAADIDVSEITSVTADVRRLERYAEELDEAKKVAAPFVREPVKTTFDIERSDETLKTAKAIVDKADEGKAFVRDAVKEVPAWAWVAGGLALGTFALSQLAAISQFFGRKK